MFGSEAACARQSCQLKCEQRVRRCIGLFSKRLMSSMHMMNNLIIYITEAIQLGRFSDSYKKYENCDLGSERGKEM